MAVEILDYIGDYIKAHNSYFRSFKVNGVQLPGGQVVEFTDGQEQRFIGVSDAFGTAGYIRCNNQINHSANERRISSGPSETGAFVKSCRLVAFCFDGSLTSETLMTKLTSDLKKVPFSTQKRRPQIIIKKSNHNYTDNVTEEHKKEAKEIGGFKHVCISIDFDLKYFSGECELCDPYNPDNNYVLIVTPNGTVIARKKPGETQVVLQFSGIVDNGPPYTNSIVDA